MTGRVLGEQTLGEQTKVDQASLKVAATRFPVLYHPAKTGDDINRRFMFA
jgi:hypothetical protein